VCQTGIILIYPVITVLNEIKMVLFAIFVIKTKRIDFVGFLHNCRDMTDEKCNRSKKAEKRSEVKTG